jgi:hypothetical protein
MMTGATAQGRVAWVGHLIMTDDVGAGGWGGRGDVVGVGEVLKRNGVIRRNPSYKRGRGFVLLLGNIK